MTTYDGPATVTADGAEYEVTARLTSTSREWYGSLDVADGAAAWAIFDADDTTLRIGDREASFVAKGGGTDMDIQGSGRPPFGA
ncbi:DUF4873 domain-containing protein [Streptomyces neyagawaensis]|uniref:DUF4873 domain-containing protein n=1 Tax=Streptomyces neyagawaensis TaxID=42238 RepID=UPI0006E20554|nr:DUF4873 domain-containing protein [Streptomyces neyagawaensis]MCL6733303.1 DUF4873 domain-containing protein [Streptomyces neyagawaensis]MDE1685105.1 DUF4873 domain-containing protein [Streptomyces neyagawaensis]